MNLIEVKDLYKHFPIKGGVFQKVEGLVKAVDGVSFSIKEGETLALVGESGSGKTTIGRTILRLIDATSGEVLYSGRNILKLGKEELRKLRPEIQIIFQDPYSSLSPRMPVGEIIGEAVKEHKIVEGDKHIAYIKKIMKDCGLDESYLNLYPHEFSGGQRQRIGIARAIALNPKFIVCDEATSSLDVSVQAQILNLLKDLQRKYKITYLFISHDLGVVEYIADSVAIMYLGNIVEYGTKTNIFSAPLHPYTKALFSSILTINPDEKKERIVLDGVLPSPANPPKGCKFHTRCPKAMNICTYIEPKELHPRGNNHLVYCHLYDEELDKMLEEDKNEQEKE